MRFGVFGVFLLESYYFNYFGEICSGDTKYGFDELNCCVGCDVGRVMSVDFEGVWSLGQK